MLRSFRVLRPLKTISGIEGLRIIVLALLKSVPLLRDALLVLGFFFLIFAIAGVQMFSGVLKRRCIDIDTGARHLEDLMCAPDGGQNCPEGYFCGKMRENPNFGVTNFDNLFFSFITVF